jgi:hypothetical protein
MRPARVWYVAYGSNVSTARFMRYVNGGETEPGCRDATPPRSSTWASASLRLSFSMQSQRWNGGGVAFVNDDSGGQTIVRAWDISGEQFEDVFSQENRLEIGGHFDWTALARGPVERGSGWYRRAQHVELDFASADQPAVTFTWSTPSPFNTPHVDYVATMRSGLAENHSLPAADIDAYLDRHLATGH